ncbi:MAG: glycosyltransferase [Cyanobacteria bacterium P01_F01_bin.53]
MLVSIVINNYNYAEFLEEAILSALNQSSKSVEVIVVDDGSTDGSRAIIEAYKNRIIPIFKQNGGQASAFNEGFKASSGEIICFLDADDYFYPDKVLEISKIFQKYTEAGWCFHELKEVDKVGQFRPRKRRCIDQFELVSLKHVLLEGSQFQHRFPATSGLCFRRQTLEEIFPMPDAFKIAADSFVRLASIYLSPGILSPNLYAVHRQHGSNLYDFRSDIQINRSKVGIKSSYYLRERYPSVRLFTNHLFCSSLRRLIRYTSLREAFDVMEARYYPRKEASLSFRIKFLVTIAKTYVRRPALLRSKRA